MQSEIIDVAGLRWKVREARSHADAMDAIASARCSGSVGCKLTEDRTLCGGGIEIIADVMQINSDGTERQPYSGAY
jgi:hypothetical protein